MGYYEKIARINLTTGEIKVEKLDVEMLLTSHGTPVPDMYERINELKTHHEVRLAEVERILGDEWKTAYECARDMKWEIEGNKISVYYDKSSYWKPEVRGDLKYTGTYNSADNIVTLDGQKYEFSHKWN